MRDETASHLFAADESFRNKTKNASENPEALQLLRYKASGMVGVVRLELTAS